MSIDKHLEQQAVTEIRDIFFRVRETLKIDHTQTHHARMFDLLYAVDSAESLLNEAWKVSKLYNVADAWIQEELVDIVKYFGKIRKDIKGMNKYKH